jgi:hypothetical protein
LACTTAKSKASYVSFRRCSRTKRMLSNAVASTEVSWSRGPAILNPNKYSCELA